MIRLAISVEGQTENEFFRRLVVPHLQAFNVYAVPIIVTTKRVLDGANHKGGDISIPRVINEVTPLLHSFDFVTTYYDFYAFKGRTPGDTALTLAASIHTALGSPSKFIPYVQQYEFESLLFSDCGKIGEHFGSERLSAKLTAAVTEKGEAELVNDSYETCPSRRIESACSDMAKVRYDKRFHGPAIAEKIGLHRIREGCPLFNSWMRRLEALNTVAP